MTQENVASVCEHPNVKKGRKKPEAIFDPPVVIEKMAATINMLDNIGDTTVDEDDFFAPPPKRQAVAAIPDLPVQARGFDGCSFSATQQASWRSAFSCLCRMADEWLRHPEQRKTAMKSERIHAEIVDLIGQLHEKWVAMNKGGRWS